MMSGRLLNHRFCLIQVLGNRQKSGLNPDDIKGNKYDVQPEFHAGPDKCSQGEAEGFRARNFRSGGDPSDPEEAKAVISFFKNREKPMKRKTTEKPLREILLTPKKGVEKAKKMDGPESRSSSQRKVSESNKKRFL